MKKILTASTLSLCLGLIIITGYILSFPVAALAARGTADCGYGKEVVCNSTYSCVCENGVGCSSQDVKGGPTIFTPCPPPPPPYMGNDRIGGLIAE